MAARPERVLAATSGFGGLWYKKKNPTRASSQFQCLISLWSQTFRKLLKNKAGINLNYSLSKAGSVPSSFLGAEGNAASGPRRSAPAGSGSVALASHSAFFTVTTIFKLKTGSGVHSLDAVTTRLSESTFV